MTAPGSPIIANIARPAPRADLDALAAEALTLTPPAGGRAMLAIVGGPGSGKSTLARALTDQINVAAPGRAASVPMDGFHRRHAELEAAGMTRLKGAPETFRPADLLAALIKARAGERISLPIYDRGIEDVVEGGFTLGDETLCLVEGNYLLLDLPIWRDVAKIFDTAWFLDLPRDEAERRLVRRHQTEPEHPRPIAEILRHVATVDLPNFDLVAETRPRAQKVLT